jgi:uncharacterized repeat protein (TIGR01451 family)
MFTPRQIAVTSLAVAFAGVSAPPALANAPAPAWAVTVMPGPTRFTPGESTGEDVYFVTATNVGGAPTTAGPITLTDILPPGLQVDSPRRGRSHFTGNDEAGNIFSYLTPQQEEEEGEKSQCQVGPPAICTDIQSKGLVRPGESLFMFVPVDVAAKAPPTVTNVVSVSGGGAPSVSVNTSSAIGTEPLPFGLPGGVQGFDGFATNADGSPDTQSGSHPYESTIGFTLNSSLTSEIPNIYPAGDMRNVTTNLPPGVIVNPSATSTRCTETQLESDLEGGGCPASSAVGTVRLTTGSGGFPHPQSSPLFNMVAPPGTPATLGFDALGFGIFVHLRGQVRTGGDYGLSATAKDILQKGEFLGAAVTLWGNPSDPSHDATRGRCFEGAGGSKGFCPVTPNNTALLTLPTSCSGPATTTISADSWQEPNNFISDSFLSHDIAGNPVGLTGCRQLDFSPSITLQPGTGAADSPTGLSVDLQVPQNQDVNGLAEAHLKDTTVTLPAGMAVNPSAANGLEACSSAQIALNSPGPASCPDASKIGSVEVDTPLLDHPLPGSVYLAKQGDNPFGSLLAIYLAVSDPVTGIVVKLAGHVEADPVTGQLTTAFKNNPQLPFSDLKLSFFGGPHAPLVTPPACGLYEAKSSLAPWSGTPPVSLANTFGVTSGPVGGPCPSGQFAPSFTSGTTNNQAGGLSPFSVTFSRQEGEQRLSAAQVRTPPGLLGVLKSVVQCPEPQASLGTCGPESQIGHTTTGAGAGPDPFYVGGNVFLTGPYKGAPFGLSIVVHAVAGPFDLGSVIVRARINVDPSTAQITVTSDALPTILQGIPLDLRTINVTVDRPGFMFNPTSCEHLSVTGTITSTGGASAAVSSPFQAANCASLPFKPSFAVSTQGKTSKANGASLVVKVAQTPGEANIHKVNLQLPLALPSRLTTLQKACIASQFERDPAGCPEGSFVGTATAHTPLLAVPLTGPAILVSHGGAAFPDVVFVLQGEGIRIDLVGNTDIKKGITFSRFETVPDAPISSFATSLPEGPHSALAAFGNLCSLTKTVTVAKHLTRRVNGHVKHVTVKVKKTIAEPLLMPTTITGQNGAVVQQTTKIAVTGCPTAKAARHAKQARKGRAAHSNRRS